LDDAAKPPCCAGVSSYEIATARNLPIPRHPYHGRRGAASERPILLDSK
jgi:hypothetical protein